MSVETPLGDLSTSGDISIAVRDGIAVATFDRPGSLNAFRSSTRTDFLAILDWVANADVVKALVLTGAGRAFSAGQDLRELDDLLPDDDYMANGAQAHLDELQQLTMRLLALEKPVIAALNGVAVGLGAELALACDIRLASAAASIGFVESQRGMFETNGVTYLLPRIVGHGHAMELLITGDLVDALEATRIGLFNRVVEPDQLLEEALRVARRIADNAPTSVRLIKDALGQTYDRSLSEMMDLEVRGMLACMGTDDLRRGVDAFLNKRQPSFRGS